MRDLRFIVALLLTLCWLVACGLLMHHRSDELLALPLNSLGDLAAGIAAPVAFLWIVVAYRQQRRQIEIASTSLAAQISAFASALEHQGKVTELAQAQLATMQESLNIERVQREFALAPNFSLSVRKLEEPLTDQDSLPISIANYGSPVGATTVHLYYPAGTRELMRLPMFDRGETYEMSAPYFLVNEIQAALRIDVNCIDSLQRPRHYSFIADEFGPLSLDIKFRRVDA